VLDAEAVGDRADAAHDLFVRARPVLFGTEQQPDEMSGVRQVFSSAESRQVVS
jgi:hypothetical protein